MVLVWTMDEEEAGPNLIVVVVWDLPDIIDLKTTGYVAILSAEQEAAVEFIQLYSIPMMSMRGGRGILVTVVALSG